MPPANKDNKRAMTIYKNKMEEYKYELKDAEDELKLDKDAYFFNDTEDTVGGNMDKFKKTDFVIVKKDDLAKRGINLDDYLVFIGDKY
jgi:cell fate regulator YaaT (PSP1 superfamily)